MERPDSPCHRRRAPFGRVLLVLVLAVVCAVPIAAPQARSRGSEVKDLELDRISRLVALGRRETTVVLLWKSSCPACREVLPSFVGYVEQLRKERVRARFLVISTDRERPALERYVSGYRMPFDVWWLAPWKPGTLTRELRSAGIRSFPDTFGVPYFAVIDAGGAVVDTWAGSAKDLARLRKAMDQAIAADR